TGEAILWDLSGGTPERSAEAGDIVPDGFVSNAIPANIMRDALPSDDGNYIVGLIYESGAPNGRFGLWRLTSPVPEMLIERDGYRVKLISDENTVLFLDAGRVFALDAESLTVGELAPLSITDEFIDVDYLDDGSQAVGLTESGQLVFMPL